MFLDVEEDDNDGIVLLSDFVASIDDQEEFERVAAVPNDDEDNTPQVTIVRDEPILIARAPETKKLHPLPQNSFSQELSKNHPKNSVKKKIINLFIGNGAGNASQIETNLQNNINNQQLKEQSATIVGA